MFDALPSLLDGLVGDERSVLLTLNRILSTRRTGAIGPEGCRRDRGAFGPGTGPSADPGLRRADIPWCAPGRLDQTSTTKHEQQLQTSPTA